MNGEKSRRRAIFFLFLSLILMLYPAIKKQFAARSDHSIYQKWKISMEQTDIEKQRQLAVSYNEDLLSGKGNLKEEYDAILELCDGILAFLRIPKIDLLLPIFHGIEETVLMKGIGHLPGSTLPIGGLGNHAVLTGHTGLSDRRMFTDLRKLELGDRFFIEILGETLEYQVDQIQVVLPEETQELHSVQRKDYCTLVTCTPYGINSHRLLVRGERVK